MIRNAELGHAGDQFPATLVKTDRVIHGPDGRLDGTRGLKDLHHYYWRVLAVDGFGAIRYSQTTVNL